MSVGFDPALSLYDGRRRVRSFGRRNPLIGVLGGLWGGGVGVALLGGIIFILKTTRSLFDETLPRTEVRQPFAPSTVPSEFSADRDAVDVLIPDVCGPQRIKHIYVTSHHRLCRHSVD